MRIKSTIRLALFLLALAPALVAQSAPMPLGDLVKLPRPARKAARIITNDDIPERPPEAKPPAPQPPASDAGSPAAEAKPSPAPAANSPLAAQLTDLTKAAASEQQILERLQQALARSGMNEAQRQTIVDALAQSQDALKDNAAQRHTLESLLAAAAPATPEPSPGAAPSPKPSPPSAVTEGP